MSTTFTHYRIGEFAEASGVSRKTLRFYDEIGLLRPAAVDPRTRYRHYLPQQLQDLASILALKELGVSLPDIRAAVGKAATRGDRRAILEELRDRVQRAIESGKNSLSWIDGALEELNRSQRATPVVVKRRPAVRIASMRAVVRNYEDILPFERELLQEVPPYSVGKLHGVLWHRCADSGSLEGEPFVEIKQQLPRRSAFDVSLLPPTTVASAFSAPDDDAEPAYDAIRNWMKIRRYSLAGPKRELYLDGMLEIQFPLKS